MVKIKKQSEAPFFLFLLKKIHNPLFTILLNVTCPFENKCFDQPLIFFKTPASHSRIHKFGKCLALLLRPFGLSVTSGMIGVNGANGVIGVNGANWVIGVIGVIGVVGVIGVSAS